MKKSDINPMPPNFAKYIDLVADVELEQAFHDSDWQLNELDKELLKKWVTARTSRANGL